MDGDIAQAFQWLRKRGIAKATSMADRSANEGKKMVLASAISIFDDKLSLIACRNLRPERNAILRPHLHMSCGLIPPRDKESRPFASARNCFCCCRQVPLLSL